jgi:hypothetical protein
LNHSEDSMNALKYDREGLLAMNADDRSDDGEVKV